MNSPLQIVLVHKMTSSFDKTEHELIGCGSASQVYLRNDSMVYKKYSASCIVAEYLSVDLIKEVAITQALKDCPYIIKICDVIVTAGDKNVGYTMKKYAGTITDKKFEPNVAQKIIYQLLTAVEHAHANFIIHGDIKPCNVLIDEDNNIVLADWGWLHQRNIMWVNLRIYTFKLLIIEHLKSLLKIAFMVAK